MQITIPQIEGNSKLGNDVFSDCGKKDNYKYLSFQPSFEEMKIIRMKGQKTTEFEKKVKLYKEFEHDMPRMGGKLREKITECKIAAAHTSKGEEFKTPMNCDDVTFVEIQ